MNENDYQWSFYYSIFTRTGIMEGAWKRFLMGFLDWHEFLVFKEGFLDGCEGKSHGED